MKNFLKQIIVLLFVALVVFFLFYNCTGNKKEEKTAAPSSEINTIPKGEYLSECGKLYQTALFHDSIILAATEVKAEVASKAIKAFTEFAGICKNDSFAPVYLMKAGQIATVINNLPQAKASFEKVISDFPEFKNRGAAMFLLAQLYDEPQYLNNEDKARELYDRIISLFPETEWAKNAHAARMMLGKTDEQIVQEFIKKNKGT